MSTVSTDDKVFQVRLETWGTATITAPTKAEAVRRARADQFDPGSVWLKPPHALTTSVKEKS